ncbi:MAG: hypothetical protein LKE43_08885 [Olsenella sp.]|jgi:predicted DNA-binding protein YlxM (UPF0122 family)|nr:hypothetical protein [Olsenella sp.]
MGVPIIASAAAAQSAVAELMSNEAEFVSFTLTEICNDVQVPASAIHDDVCAEIPTALSQWEQTVSSNADAVNQIYAQLQEADNAAASNMLSSQPTA